MNIVTIIHILDPESNNRIARFTLADGWKGHRGKWTETPFVSHPSEPDPLAAYAEALKHDGYSIETEEAEEETVEGRIH